MSTESTDRVGIARGTTSRSLRVAVDWLVGGFLLLWGALFGAVGYALYATADRARIAEAVADGTLTSDGLTDAELIDVTFVLQESGGVALAVTGALLVVASVVFLAVRIRSRPAEAEAGPDTLTNAIVGALVSAVTSFVPLSPVLGGGVAAYLQGGDRGEGARVGGLSGLVGVAPVVVLLVLTAVVFGVAAAEVGVGGVVAAVVAVAVLFATALAVLYAAVLGALGGYLAVALAERSERRRERVATD